MFKLFKRNTRPGLLTARVEALSDSIFGFAITLLVLSITVPELTSVEVARGELLSHLINLWPKLVTYLISAFVISIFWIGHTILFHFVKRSDRVFIWFNTFFIICIAFFPFPVALLGKYPLAWEAIVVYGGTLVVTGLFFCAMWFYATKERRLINEKLSDDLVSKGNLIVIAAPIAYLVAILLAFVNIYIPLTIYILLPILYTVPSPVDDLVDAAGE